jgi:hypothetical protein
MKAVGVGVGQEHGVQSKEARGVNRALRIVTKL